MFQVEIWFHAGWYPIGLPYSSRDDAEWSIAGWRDTNGSNGMDTGFRVVEVSDEERWVQEALLDEEVDLFGE